MKTRENAGKRWSGFSSDSHSSTRDLTGGDDVTEHPDSWQAVGHPRLERGVFTFIVTEGMPTYFDAQQTKASRREEPD
ncbi:hypothetical protein K0M31_008254 [Melipona bicolor]|uniref:Uncharacterized protein n=1 Tax=Melipona bicolor TaxID=60889 RepID=A0AA40KKE6_9HYME|nr:hypothetical protein K0M31_008254 [Melipona bicolor]